MSNHYLSYFSGSDKTLQSDDIKTVNTVWNILSANTTPSMLFLKKTGEILSYNDALHRLANFSKTEYSSVINWLSEITHSHSENELTLINRSINEGSDCSFYNYHMTLNGNDTCINSLFFQNVTIDKRKTDYMILQIKMDYPEDILEHQNEKLMEVNKILRNEIKEHKQLKKELKLSRQRLELILEGGDLKYWDYDIVNDKILFSEKVYEMFGYKPGDFNNTFKGVLEIIHEEDQEVIINSSRKHLLKNEPFFEVTFRSLTSKGTWIWVLVKGKIVEHNKKGMPIRAAGILSNVTEKREMEARLLENEDRYWNLFNNMKSGVAIFESSNNGKNFILKELNKSGEKIDKLNLDHVLNTDLTSIYPAAEKHGLLDIFRKVYKTGAPIERNSRYYSDDRISGWRFYYVYKLPSDEIVFIFDDLSEKKSAEEEALLQKKKYRELVENISEGICVIDDRGFIKFASPSMTDMIGYSINEMLGRPFYSFMSNHYRTIYYIHLQKLELGEKIQGDFEFVHKNGSLVYTRIDSSPLNDSEENYIGAITSITDITEHKRIDEELKNTGKLLASVFNSIHDQLVVIDKDYNVLMSNLKDYRILRERNQYNNIHCYECIMDRKSPCPDCEALEIFQSGMVKVFERKNDFTGKICDVRMFPILDDYGNVTMVVQHLRDISDKKIAEEKIKSSLHEKEFLLKEIHHRVKNNMQVISSILNLQSRYIEDIRDVELFKESQNRVRAMALVHEKLYQSSDLSNIDFDMYINEFISYLFYSYNINPEKIGLSIDVQSISLSIDMAIPIAQIINEVISNSLKHAFPGNKKGLITINFFHDDEGYYRLLMSDNGIGFPDDFNIDSSETLGMQLINALVMQLQGNIVINKNRGASYDISFK